MAEAIERLPAKVGDLYRTFQDSPDETRAREVLEQLNAVYRNAQSIEDTRGLDCGTSRDSLAYEDSAAHAALTAAEARLAQAQGRTTSLQSGLKHSQAEINSVQTQFEQHRASCAQNIMLYTGRLKILRSDLTNARGLALQATSDCTAGGSSAAPPALVQCTLPDDAVVATFKDQSLRTLVAALANSTEKLLSASIDEAIRQADGTAASSLLAAASRHHRASQRQGTQSLLLMAIPENLCTDARLPSCAAYQDSMATFLGHAEDAIDDLRERMALEATQCDESAAAYESSVNLFRQEAEVANLALASAVSSEGALAAIRQRQQLRLRDFEAELARGLSRCAEEVAAAAERKASASRVWRELHIALADSSAADAAFIGDCLVGAWSFGECSQSCGTGGQRNLTRTIEDGALPGRAEMCPALEMTRPCNERPCLTDAETGWWSEWSSCTRMCGGGVRTRRRTFLQLDTPYEKLANSERECEFGKEITTEAECKAAIEAIGLTSSAVLAPSNSGMPLLCSVSVKSGSYHMHWNIGAGGRGSADVAPICKKEAGRSLEGPTEEELCNPQTCDADCDLSEWTTWSNCSGACMGGHKTRERYILRPPSGRGRCPEATDAARREAVSCNTIPCGAANTTVKCASALDVVLVLDGSGSVNAEGFDAAKRFAAGVIKRVKLEGETLYGSFVGPTGNLTGAAAEAAAAATRGSRIGLVSFGASAEDSRDLTASRSALLESLEALEWPAGQDQAEVGTNTAAALAVARSLLESHVERPGAQTVVVVITDGAPASARLAREEAARLRELGARLAFVTVGADASLGRRLGRWASWPWKHNMFEVPSYKALSETAHVTELLAALCPVLALQ